MRRAPGLAILVDMAAVAVQTHRAQGRVVLATTVQPDRHRQRSRRVLLANTALGEQEHARFAK